MATTAAGYGCCLAGLPPFPLLPGILSTRLRREPSPPRVALVASSPKLRAPAPRCAPF
jgi:mitochondrial protein import protein ZIM17